MLFIIMNDYQVQVNSRNPDWNPISEQYHLACLLIFNVGYV